MKSMDLYFLSSRWRLPKGPRGCPSHHPMDFPCQPFWDTPRMVKSHQSSQITRWTLRKAGVVGQPLVKHLVELLNHVKPRLNVTTNVTPMVNQC